MMTPWIKVIAMSMVSNNIPAVWAPSEVHLISEA